MDLSGKRMDNRNMTPVFIDKSEGNDVQQTVRFYYFVVTFQESGYPYPDLKIGDSFAGDSFLFRMFSSLPVIWLESNHQFILSGPLGGGFFNKAEQINVLFEFLEEHNVEVDAVFHTFQNTPGRSYLNIQRGEIYRLEHKVLSAFESPSGESPMINNNNMMISNEETEVFSEWNKLVVEGVKTRYRAQPERTLRQRVKGEDQ